MVQAVVLLVILNCSLGQAAFEELKNTVFVRENGTAELEWSLCIRENAGRSSVHAMIKKRDTLLCQWVKLHVHGEVNLCDPGLNLTISPKQVRVPGPTNFTATFSFKNKGRSDDGTYECRFVIDGKWHEMQVYPRQLVTIVEPNVALNATYSNTSKTDFICHVRGGRPKPVETILIKNGSEISSSRLICPEEAGDTDHDGVSYCSSIHSVEDSGGQFKCRVEHTKNMVDSVEVDIPFRMKENETRAPLVLRNDCACTACIAYIVISSIIALVMIRLLVQERRKHSKSHGSGNGESHLPREHDFGNGQVEEIPAIAHVEEHKPCEETQPPYYPPLGHHPGVLDSPNNGDDNSQSF